MPYVTNTFIDGDNLSIPDLQDIINNQEIAYNQILAKPRGILRVGIKATPMDIQTDGVTNQPYMMQVASIRYEYFELNRLYRVKAMPNLIKAMPDSMGYMKVVDDLQRVIRQQNFTLPNMPNMMGFFRPTKKIHTITWYASVINHDPPHLSNTAGQPGDGPDHYSWSIINVGATTQFSALILEDMGLYTPGNGPKD